MTDRNTRRTRKHTISGLLACSLLLSAADVRASSGCPAHALSIEAAERTLEDPPFQFYVPLYTFIRNAFVDLYTNDCLRLNQIQMLGTHNSYHLQPSPALHDYLLDFTPAAEAWEYSHLTLEEQLDTQGVRQIELDVYADPQGGAYFFRLGPQLVGERPWAPFLMLAPGMKVLHVEHVDFETSCISLIKCLQIVKRWSDRNPKHLPVTILIETKSRLFEDETGARLEAFGAAALDAVDAEIRSVFSEDELLTPDDVRGHRATLEEAVLSDGWPVLGGLRGKVLFALDNAGDERLAYIDGHPSLEGRVMFTNSTPGQPDAAFIERNDPVGSGSEIAELVTDGYIVRTRADADTVEARAGDTSRRNAALESGAQFVSTDFPVPSTNSGFSDYFVEVLAGSQARCNPVIEDYGCRDDGLE